MHQYLMMARSLGLPERTALHFPLALLDAYIGGILGDDRGREVARDLNRTAEYLADGETGMARDRVSIYGAHPIAGAAL